MDFEALRKELHDEIGVYLYGDELEKMLDIVKKYVPTKSFSKGIQNEEEQQIDNPRFHGKDYDEKIDQLPLKKSALKIFHFLASNPKEWFTGPEIAEHLKTDPVTTTNRIRDFRTERWGSHKTPKRRRAGTRLWEYTLIPNKESLTWHEYLKVRDTI